MTSALAPYSIALGGILAVVFCFAAFWRQIQARMAAFYEQLGEDLALAGMTIQPQQLATVAAVSIALLWLGYVLFGHPGVLPGLLALPVAGMLVLVLSRRYILTKRAKRAKLFGDQFEEVLRSLASAIRAGMSLQQALMYVGQESPEPSKTEFSRIVGATNLGIGIFDAFDQMAERMHSEEVALFVRVARVQAKSGGNFGAVLERLADTIRAKRQFARKLSAMTSQARATAWLLGCLPPAILAFILVTQPTMRDAALGSLIGQASIIGGLGLDALAVFSLSRIMKLDV